MDRGTENSISLIERVKNDIDHHRLFQPGQKILVCVSGGVDSVVLLKILAEIASMEGREYLLTVAHFDHRLRQNSSADADFVSGIAKEMSLDVIVDQGDVAAEADRLGEGIEHAAREARYAFFRKVALEYEIPSIALAHHADDNIETILFRILRGTALRGLAGISMNRSLSDIPSVRIVRPLLSIHRQQIVDFAVACELRWREDDSNRQMNYSRNFIRGRLLPLIRDQLNPRAGEALLRLGRHAQQVEEFLVLEAGKLLEESVSHSDAERVLIDIGIFRLAAPVVRMTAIRKALETLGIPERGLSAEHFFEIETLLKNSGVVNLPGGYEARTVNNQLLISSPST